jgi:two-component system phosphate regulon sensor histidine kinase PhoR
LLSYVLLPAILVAVGVLGYFTFRTTFQLEKLRQQAVIEATLALATEKADRLDKRLITEDNVVIAVADPAELERIGERWLPTAQRETPTVRAILVLDESYTVVAFASRATSAWGDDDAFRRLLVHRMLPDMELGAQPVDQLRHLHREYGGQSYLVSYWQRIVDGRRFLVVAWHDLGRIVKDILPAVYGDASGAAASPPARVNVVDEEGRIIFGPPLRSGEFTVGVRFPTTLYEWRVQISPTASEELATRVEHRRTLELAFVTLSCVVIVAGVATILFVAERQRRLNALKSDFVANVSHELKTPLALVRMFGEMLQTGRVASEAKRQEYLDIIVAESERLSNLIENVLDFAKVERGRGAYDFADGDVGQVVARAVQVYRYRAEREGVALECEVEPKLCARIDERAIQLAVINLVDNALKYAAGSTVVRVSARRDGGAVAIRVADHGPGIPPEEQGRIFERFVRGSRASGETARVRGSGIGLALVKHIAESHGGKAWVESEVGRGATFVVRIPSSRKDTGPLREAGEGAVAADDAGAKEEADDRLRRPRSGGGARRGAG